MAVLAAGISGLVGAFALMKRTILAGDVMSHIALPGLGIALLLKINPLIGAAATLLLGVFIIAGLEKHTGLNTEVAIGVIFAASVAIGALITPKEDLIEALFGGFSSISASGFVVGLAMSLVVLFSIWKLKDKLLIGLFSPELAASLGINLGKINFYYLLIFAATILLGLRLLGAILVGALIIIPAATGRQLTHNLSKFLGISAFVGIASISIGLVATNYWNLPLGPTTIVASAALFVLSLMKKRV